MSAAAVDGTARLLPSRLLAFPMAPLVRSFHHLDSATWTHVVVDPVTRHAAIIDPVLDYDPASGRLWTDSARRVLEYVGTTGLNVEWILETHAHADHLTAAAWLRDTLGGAARIGVGAGIERVQRHFAGMFGLDEERLGEAAFDVRFDDGDRFRIGALEVDVLATPGHTPDGVSYRIGDAVFVGDTLFAPRGGSARCDFPGGSATLLYASIQRLYALPDTTRVFLAHDYPPAGEEPIAETSIGAEKAGNIHVRVDTAEQAFVEKRHARDATLGAPRLLWPSLQFNLLGGRWPLPGADGRPCFTTPVKDER